MPKISILFTRPNHDYETSCLYYFSKNLVKEIKEIGEYTVINLEGFKANKREFEKSMKKAEPRLVVLNGHGNKDAICGHKDEVILEDDNIRLLQSTITYAIACDSSEKLGDIATKRGNADAYVGYDAYFMVVTDPTRSSNPSKDKNIKVFKKPYAAMVLSLVSGRTVSEAISETKGVLRSLIREYGVYGIRDKYGDAPLIRFALFWDLHFLTGYGDLSSAINQ